MCVALYTPYFPSSVKEITCILLGWDSNPRPYFSHSTAAACTPLALELRAMVKIMTPEVIPGAFLFPEAKQRSCVTLL